MRGASRRLTREHDNRAWLAWHIAALDRVKKLPKLAILQSREPTAKTKAKTPETAFAAFSAWARSYQKG